MSTTPGSGRSSSKAQSQTNALGGAIRAKNSMATDKSRSFNLVVCGTDLVTDGWIFSDFLGFAMLFKEHEADAQLLTCFPTEQHMDCQSHKFYQQIAADRLKSKVQQWIWERMFQARPGDVVNIVLLCHGNRDGDFSLGNSWLKAVDLANSLSSYRDGVQVNLFSSACHSGHLARAIAKTKQTNRYVSVAAEPKKLSYAVRTRSGRWRSGRWANAFVTGALGIVDPGTNMTAPVTIADHENWIQTKLRKVSAKSPTMNPIFHSDISPTTSLKDLLFRISEPAEPITPPRSIEWPKITAIVQDVVSRGISSWALDSQSQSSDLILPPSALATANRELSLCNTELGFPPDLGVFTSLSTIHPEWKGILANLYWRSFRQVLMLEIFLTLLRKGLVNLECLTAPIDLYNPTTSTFDVAVAISRFSLLMEDSEKAFRGKLPLQSTEWSTDIEWLATMILRSRADISDVLNVIKNLGLLGTFDKESFRENDDLYADDEIRYDDDPTFTPSADKASSVKNNVFGFWLPHGLSGDSSTFLSQLQQCLDRAAAIESAYKLLEPVPVGLLILSIDLFIENPRSLDELPSDESSADSKTSACINDPEPTECLPLAGLTD
ncbi:hypothetical protein N7456_000916 [Penicillium angulare]|uniref:Uncharacterized protein n=1 Tax=Penicillium angulare TaxID=116970 RepID=A0A9W9KSC3_9EURO|nr:hypothetical protein N7456_000916 [Penicillium angulare]